MAGILPLWMFYFAFLPISVANRPVLQQAADLRTGTYAQPFSAGGSDTFLSRYLHLFLGQHSGTVPALTPELLSWSWESVAPLATEATVPSADWPKLETNGSWDTRLKDPRVYAISLEAFKKRRLSFAEKFNKQAFITRSAQWMPAVDGSKIPKHLSNPHGDAASGAEKGFRDHNPGVLGCLLSHILVLRDHLHRCSGCDLIVFEDDIAFHPNFTQLWAEFIGGIPPDVPVGISGEDGRAPVAKLHFGGDAFWSPPLVTAGAYYQVGGSSRTWGYVMKAHAIEKMLAYLRERDSELNVAIDSAMTDPTFIKRFPVLAPKQPLVAGIGIASTTGMASFENADQGVAELPDQLWEKNCWTATYTQVQKCETNVTEEERRALHKNARR